MKRVSSNDEATVHSKVSKTPLGAQRRPLVLVHGWGGSFDATYASCGWCEAVEISGRTLVKVDLPGHGTEVASHNSDDYRDLATDLEKCLPEGILDAIGYSLGGKLLIELAIRHPGRFRRLVIGGVGDNIFAPERSGEAVASALEHGVGPNTPPPVTAMIAYAQVSLSDPLALAAVLRRPANPVITPTRLSTVSADVLIVNGDSDPVALPDQALVEALSQGSVMRIPGLDHIGLPGDASFQRLALDFVNN